MEHEALVGEAGQAVDHLLGFLGAERGRADRLGLAAGEQGRAVGARQEADHRLDRADLAGGAAVDALALLEDGGADDLGLELLDQLVGGHLVLRGRVGERRLGLGAGLVERVRAGRFVGQLVGGGDVLADQVLELRLGGREVGLLGHVPGILGGLLGELDDRLDHLLALAMGEHDGAEHDLFRKLLGFGFDHHHRVMGAGDDEIELRLRGPRPSTG